jgi:hypothetical protein
MADPVLDANGNPVVPPVVAPPVLNDREANLRAELAAERVRANGLQASLGEITNQLNATKESIPTLIAAEVGKVTPAVQALQTKLIDAEIKAEAAAAGLVDMDLLPLIDKATIKFDDAGAIIGVKEAIDAKKAAKPDWFKPAQAAVTTTTAVKTTGAGATPAPNGTGVATPVPVAALDKKDYTKFKAEQLALLKGAARN